MPTKTTKPATEPSRYASTIHPFEERNLGKAPFRFTGVYPKTYCAGPGAPIQPAGECQYCGNCIKWCCVIESADGRSFVVGNECVRKTCRQALVDEVEKAVYRAQAPEREARNKVRREKAEAKRMAQFKLDTVTVDAARELFARPEVAAYFAEKAHPNFHYASEGKTYADYITWQFECGSMGGRLRVAAEITAWVAENLEPCTECGEPLDTDRSNTCLQCQEDNGIDENGEYYEG